MSDGVIFMSEVSDPANFDYSEKLLLSRDCRRNCLRFKTNCGLYLLHHDKDGWRVEWEDHEQQKRYRETLWRLMNAHIEEVPKSLMPDEPQPDHVIGS